MDVLVGGKYMRELNNSGVPPATDGVCSDPMIPIGRIRSNSHTQLNRTILPPSAQVSQRAGTCWMQARWNYRSNIIFRVSEKLPAVILYTYIPLGASLPELSVPFHVAV